MLVSSRCDVKGSSTTIASCLTPWRRTAALSAPRSRVPRPFPEPATLTIWKEAFCMLRLESWLYRYVSMYAHYLLYQALAALVPSLVYRPVLQRVRPHAAPGAIRLRRDYSM